MNKYLNKFGEGVIQAIGYVIATGVIIGCLFGVGWFAVWAGKGFLLAIGVLL